MARVRGIHLGVMLAFAAFPSGVLRAQDARESRIDWQRGYTNASQEAIRSHKPLIVFLVTTQGDVSRQLGEEVTRDRRIADLADRAVFVWMPSDLDDPSGHTAGLIKYLKVESFPCVAVFDCQSTGAKLIERLDRYTSGSVVDLLQRTVPAPTKRPSPFTDAGGFAPRIDPQPDLHVSLSD